MNYMNSRRPAGSGSVSSLGCHAMAPRPAPAWATPSPLLATKCFSSVDWPMTARTPRTTSPSTLMISTRWS
ncbi:hypothetical protein E2C01_075416 [Portunus trituberculatus]|uniref:Uncharacterized protein n=1 Tax=Portunus trituberculatus TaxID=210409 RepID=A0A5B7IEX6_PORTR|nr:hypothetical protein [Portunus trituberculatus]